MSLAPGTRLGPYEILAPIGAGGMGEVYRARDTTLDREVAIKVLPDALADDSEHLARFRREAKVLAALNHPNVAQIYALVDGALAMELIAGETIRGPLRIETALSYAKQIAEALEAAHEKGIVHRDLKPGNIMVTRDGVIKVLDFGLAKTVETSAPSTDPSISPTLTLVSTRVGIVMGTAAYMSPEQAQGYLADKRTDIWAFGVLLWELLTGHHLFQRETVSQTLAEVVHGPIYFDKLARQTPPAIAALLRRCLDRNVKNRLRDIGEARIMIGAVLSGEIPSATSKPESRGNRRLWFIGVAAAALAVIGGTSLWGWLRPRPIESRPVMRFSTTLPELWDFPGAIALSPDGSRLAFVGGQQYNIHVRMMDQLEAKAIPGTDQSAFICFSPDGQSISYIGEPGMKLKKVALAGGPAQDLADIGAMAKDPSESWGRDHNILYSTNGVVMRVPAAGGVPRTLATPDSKKNEDSFSKPQLLPGGREILIGIAYIPHAGELLGRKIAALNLQTGEKKILDERSASSARYVHTGPGSSEGYVVYYANTTGSLMAVPYDVSRGEISGSPVSVLDGVRNLDFDGLWDVSNDGTLVYLPGAASRLPLSTLIWVDRKGVEDPLPAPPRSYNSVGSLSLSPDGRRIAVAIGGQETAVWVYDLDRDTLRKITSNQPGTEPIWTPDGKQLIYRQDPRAVVRTSVDASSPPATLTNSDNGTLPIPTSVSPDGKVLIGYFPRKGLWVLPLPESSSYDDKPKIILPAEAGSKRRPMFSPDGRWIAYASDETGESEIYVTPYPGPGGKFLISTGGGSPHWSHDGRELFYRDPNDKMLVVDLHTSPSFRAGKPRVMFDAKHYGQAFDVSRDGKRFLMTKPSQSATDQVTVVLNWVEELRHSVPSRK